VYKAKIGRDAIVDIHVRSLRSDTLLLPSKVDGVSGKAKVRSTFIYLQGVLCRFPDRYLQQSAQRFIPAQDIKLQVPPPNTATYPNESHRCQLASLYSLHSHTKEKKKRSSDFQRAIENELGANSSTLRP
jgi:hypothetical protein